MNLILYLTQIAQILSHVRSHSTGHMSRMLRRMLKENVKTKCSLKIGHLITFVQMAVQGEITDVLN